VIPLAVQNGFGSDCEPLSFLPSDYLLYVGSRKGYKDFALLPKALELLRGEGIDLPLVTVGSPFTSEEIAELLRRGLISTVTNYQLSDEDLKRAYAHCTLVVQTSRYEGFGLTPLEGMASGVPVVVANSSSMPEVGGDVAIYFSPGDATDLARAMLSVLSDDELRRILGLRGILRAAEFSTTKMAQKTAEAYAELLEPAG